jgi:hypothetical protein
MLRSPATEWLASDAAILYEESGASSYDIGFPGDGEQRGTNPASASTSSAAVFLAKQADDAIRWLVTSNDEANNNNNNNSTTNATGSNSTSTGEDTASASTVLRDTFVVYGTVLGVLLLVFCCVRVKFPRPYTIRKWVEEVKVSLLLAAVVFLAHWAGWRLFLEEAQTP